MRVVIDTNVFVSSFFNPKGNPKKIIDLWKSEKLILCITQEILQEYIEVLIRLGLSDEPELEELLNLFKKKINIVFSNSTPKIEMIKDDPDDNKFLECATSAKAGYIISGDKHLLNLKIFQNIKIITPLNFLNQYKNKEESKKK